MNKEDLKVLQEWIKELDEYMDAYDPADDDPNEVDDLPF